MSKFKTRVKEVDAVQWWKLGDHPDVEPCDPDDPQDEYGWIATLHGAGVVEPGDWVVTFPKGEVLVYDEAWFREMFEPSETEGE